MDWIKQLNETMSYIEDNLTEEVDYKHVASMAGCSIYNFQRMFSYVAGVPLSEYIRNRRLTMAAFEILNGRERLLDVALKWGYDSPEAFSRAFRNFHGVLPSVVRNGPATLKSCPKLSFQLTIKGEDHMNYQIKQYPAFSVAGISHPMPTSEVYQRVPKIWEDFCQNGDMKRMYEEVLSKTDYHPSGFLGIAMGGDWGKSAEMDYIVGVTNFVDVPGAPRLPAPDWLHEFQLPAATWVVFQAEGELPESVQNIHKRFYSEWLVNSGYGLADLPCIECYLEDENHQQHQEVWIGIVKN